jgi:hypothetical protein
VGKTENTESGQFSFAVFNSVAEPHNIYAALAPGKNFAAAPERQNF